MKTTTIQSDFDRGALLDTDHWDHSKPYYGFLAKSLSSNCKKALDIGYGTGSFTRLLSRCVFHVIRDAKYEC